MNTADFEPTRHTLIQRLKNLEDQDSWQDFFNTYWRLIYTVAIRSGLNETEAQDVVQETTVTVMKNIDSFRTGAEHGSFRAWLLRITRWRIADQHRKRPRASQSLQRLEDPDRTSTAERVPDPVSLEMDAYWESHWKQNLMEAALQRIKQMVDPADYQLYDWHVLKGMPALAVARKLGAKMSRVYLVKYRLSRLLKLEVKRLTRKYG